MNVAGIARVVRVIRGGGGGEPACAARVNISPDRAAMAVKDTGGYEFG